MKGIGSAEDSSETKLKVTTVTGQQRTVTATYIYIYIRRDIDLGLALQYSGYSPDGTGKGQTPCGVLRGRSDEVAEQIYVPARLEVLYSLRATCRTLHVRFCP